MEASRGELVAFCRLIDGSADWVGLLKCGVFGRGRGTSIFIAGSDVGGARIPIM